MYKSGTQLIITELWAAAAADKLGFKVEPLEGEFNCTPNKYKILVTESGPNAAERLYPQRNDLIETVNDTHFVVTELLPDDPVWAGNKNQSGIQNPYVECRRIIERNNTPFPQFSEVIEP